MFSRKKISSPENKIFLAIFCHSRVGGNPEASLDDFVRSHWIPAYAGMTRNYCEIFLVTFFFNRRMRLCEDFSQFINRNL